MYNRGEIIKKNKKILNYMLHIVRKKRDARGRRKRGRGFRKAGGKGGGVGEKWGEVSKERVYLRGEEEATN